MVAMATDHVVNPQIWPQTNLQYEYVSKGVTFQQLDFKLFVARELEIISSKNIGDKEKKARVALLKKNCLLQFSISLESIVRILCRICKAE